MSTNAANPVQASSDREIVTTRVFNVPRERLFRAWTDPEQLAQWWGPKGFTNTFQEFDLRLGGSWRFVMRGPNGVEHPNENVFVEIVEPERLVLHHLGPVHEFLATFLFEDLGGRTRLVWSMLFASAEEYEKMKSFVPTANEQNLDRLEAVLAQDGG
ncbi:MAG TPA: SRPBCC family protein [Thermoanaerobaculia bacterium]|nr:SRPBCC family protein [Thermoanaerobaculia bacterium]